MCFLHVVISTFLDKSITIEFIKPYKYVYLYMYIYMYIYTLYMYTHMSMYIESITLI